MYSKIDRLIAEKVMGWELAYTVGYPKPNQYAYKDGEGNTHKEFSPSTKLDDAWLALDTMCKKNEWYAIIERYQNTTQVNLKGKIGNDLQYLGHQESPTLAICQILLETIDIEFETVVTGTYSPFGTPKLSVTSHPDFKYKVGDVIEPINKVNQYDNMLELVITDVSPRHYEYHAIDLEGVFSRLRPNIIDESFKLKSKGGR